MSLDRELQLAILKRLESDYPASVSEIHNQLNVEPEIAIKNIHYLASHGLLSAQFSGAIGVRIAVPGPAKITHHGLDFLADDGGLGAILRVVTVKLHEDTLRQVITSKIEASDLPKDEKTSLIKTLKELPGEAIKHLSEKLIDLGLDNAPNAVALIYKAIQHVQL